MTDGQAGNDWVGPVDTETKGKGTEDRRQLPELRGHSHSGEGSVLAQKDKPEKHNYGKYSSQLFNDLHIK